MKIRRRRDHFSVQAIFIYALVGLIVGTYIFYFHRAIPNKEKTLHNKGVKTLGNIEVGISEKVKHYDQIINQKIKIESFKKICPEEVGPEAKNIFKDYFDQSLHLNDTLSNTLFEKGNIAWVEINDGLNVAYKSNSPDTIAYLEIDSLMWGSVDAINRPHLKKTARYYSKWTVSIHDFMDGIFDNELFECIVLIDDSTKKIVYSNNSSILGEGAHYKAEKADSTRYGVHVDSVEVNSMPYQEFCKEIEIADKSFVVLGFMSQSAVESYTKQVSYWVLILISFITIILISAVPTIKVFILNTWERLRDSDATNSAVGLIALVFFVALMLSALVFFNQVENQNNKGVEKYNKVLQAQLETELTSRLNELNDLKKLDLTRSSLPAVKYIRYHEIFEVPLQSGAIEKIILPLSGTVYKEDEDDLFKKFMHYLFSSNTNISKRKYISEIVGNRGFSSDSLDNLNHIRPKRFKK